MKADTASAWARLRGALYGASPKSRPGKCLVSQADLEFLLAEVEQLSNAQTARYLTRIVLEDLRNGEPQAASQPRRPVERRGRRIPFLRGADHSADRGGIPEVAEPFVFGEECATVLTSNTKAL